MAIIYDNKTGLIRLETKNTEYQIKINQLGMPMHLYYGKKVNGCDMSYQNVLIDRGFSGNPYESKRDRGLSFDLLPQEYTGCGIGDYRVSGLSLVSGNGSRSCDLRFKTFSITEGKQPMEALPSVRANDDQVDSLCISLEDSLIGLSVNLIYSVFYDKDVITRRAVLTNMGSEDIELRKAASMVMDFSNGHFDLVHFCGSHNRERNMERVPVGHDIHVVSSRRGMSSHHENPFVILCDQKASENQGDCYGFMLMYSGNHKTEVETNQAGTTRITMGIGDENFQWKLDGGASFETPEAILSYSPEGFNGLSYNYHGIIRENVCHPKYLNIKRPVLINNWEATYFDFDAEKIRSLIGEAAKLGIEMFVLDDGWFGNRCDDNAGLGDWFVNMDKLPGGLKELTDCANSHGMRFGLWFEPEMINEDTKLFRQHPEWVMRDPDREPMMSRNQMMLDMGNPDVIDYLYECITKVLDSANIEYVKWDYNRSMSNVFSNVLGADRQGETAHRFILGTYKLLGMLLDRYPKLMIEGCAGGGGRFDAGMLYYCPQIWCSDDTDPIARLGIQAGTSYGYPVSTMGSHVSAAPNHQTGRITTLKTRGVVAMSGTFGYELDITKLSSEEKEIIKTQIKDFHEYYDLISHGRYYRLSEGVDRSYYTAWAFVSEDKRELLLNVVVTDVMANPVFPCIKLCGLAENAIYKLAGKDRNYTGAALMNGGYVLEELIDRPEEPGSYPTFQLHFKAV